MMIYEIIAKSDAKAKKNFFRCCWVLGLIAKFQVVVEVLLLVSREMRLMLLKCLLQAKLYLLYHRSNEAWWYRARKSLWSINQIPLNSTERREEKHRR